MTRTTRNRGGMSRETNRSSAAILSLAAAGFPELLADAGFEPDRLFHDFAKQTPTFDRHAKIYLLSDYCSLLHAAAFRTDMPNFGLKLGLRNSFQILGALAYEAATFPTFRRVLDYLCENFQSLQQQSELRLHVDGGWCTLKYRIRDGRISNRRQDSELTIAVLLTFLRQLSTEPLTLDHVYFEHPPPLNASDYQRLLDTDVAFGANENTISFSARHLYAPTRADAFILPFPSSCTLSPKFHSSSQDDLVGIITDEIRYHLSQGEVSMPFLATKLGLSESSLYRLLRDANTSFSHLVRTVRERQSIELLALPHIPLSEVSLLLGYSEQSAFTRAFSNWAGVSPKVYRSRLLRTPLSAIK